VLVLILSTFALIESAAQLPDAGKVSAAGQNSNPVPTLQPASDSETGVGGADLAGITPGGVLTRTRSISPAAFIRDEDDTGILMDTDLALRWAAGSTDQAGFYMRRPADWNETTPVKVTLYFALGGSTAGAVNWRLKLNSYTPNSGEWLTNPGTRDSDAILNFADGPSWYRVYSQSFTLQPVDFNNEPLWSFFFLRGNGSNGETFAGYLYLLDVELEYEAVSPLSVLFSPLIDR
jgi:hypothetical protein